MLKRVAVFVGVLALGAFIYVQFMPAKSTVTVTNARAVPMGASGDMFMVTLSMQNDGGAVTLTEATSPSGAEVSVMNMGQSGPLVIPADGKGLLAMDGAHLMLHVPGGDFEEGAYHSISLAFDDGSTVVSRILRPKQHGGRAMMDHSMTNGVEVSPSPTISFAAPPSVSADGFRVNLSVENFDFVPAPDGATHAPNKGHAHIYLNGLKLGRLYEDSFNIGALSPGDYVLRVALNSNDHRPYVLNGTPVEAAFAFKLP